MSSTSVGRFGRRRLGALAAAAAFLVGACGGGASPSAGPVTLNALFMKQAAYSEENVTEMAKAFEAANTNVKVNLEFVAYDALHDKIVTDQAGGAGTYDTVLLDAIWPAEFAKAKLVRDITDKIPAEYKNDVFASALAGGEYQGKFYACPGSRQKFSSTTRPCSPRRVHRRRTGRAPRPGQGHQGQGPRGVPIVWSWNQAEAAICD